MGQNYTIRRQSNQIIYTETLILSGVLSGVVATWTEHHWSLCIFTFLLFVFVIINLFFKSKIFRYILTIGLSLMYAGGAFALGFQLDTTTGVVAGILALAISLYLHKSHFKFVENSEEIRYN